MWKNQRLNFLKRPLEAQRVSQRRAEVTSTDTDSCICSSVLKISELHRLNNMRQNQRGDNRLRKGRDKMNNK